MANTYADGPVHNRDINAFTGGVLTPSGNVVFAPASSTTVCTYAPAANTFTSVTGHGRGNDAFRGGVLTPTGKVVLVPFNSTTISIFTPNPLLSVSESVAMSPYLNKF